ncbi:hypothetical protein ACSFA3_01325 [Variovorax sp. RHLX14]|uniref:hypothetical protein n=1 Tax=Variovorax sp. RHLX14 TaxID=1259731 RepID=UPI003F4525B6
MTVASTPRTPPRFVPTLTTVIEPEGENEIAAVIDTPDSRTTMALDLDPASQRTNEENVALEEELLQRVLERVDASLENELSDVVAAAVQAQLDVMVPQLRSEIEKVLRRLVTDALARELRANPGSTLA